MGKVSEGTLLSVREHQLNSSVGTRCRWKRLIVLSAVALAVHWVALSGLQWVWPQQDAAPLSSSVAMQVRSVSAAVPVVPVVPVVSPFMQPAVSAMPRAALVKAAAVRPKVDRIARKQESVPAESAVPAFVEPPVLLALAAAAPADNVAPMRVMTAEPAPAPSHDAAPPDENTPIYLTRVPPAATFKYRIRRGLLSGTGDLQWRPTKDHYELRLESKVAGLTILTQVSQGGFDRAGLAPVRFTDQRLRRATSAANFQRDVGKITFSGPSTEFALRPGSQDRLSWMVQLAAIVSADAALRQAGAKIVMNVVGSNGDLAVWSFRCNGNEPIEGAGGTVDALSYVREPHDPHDTRAEVWLDPSHHYMPAHATLKSGANDDGLDLRLQEVLTTP